VRADGDDRSAVNLLDADCEPRDDVDELLDEDAEDDADRPDVVVVVLCLDIPESMCKSLKSNVSRSMEG
jgi:hypothetical protein